VSVVVSEMLAQMSNTLVYSAMLVYTGALGAFAVDLSGRGRVAAGESPRSRSDDPRPGERVSGRVSGRVPGKAAGTPDGGVIGDDENAAGRRPGAVRPGSGGPTTRSPAGGIAVRLTWLAMLLHLAGVIARGLSAQRAPFGDLYEFTISGSVVVIAVFLLLLTRLDLRYLGTFVTGPVLLTLGLAVAVFYTQAAQLVPALNSFWLVIHVSVAFVSSALFTLGFSTSVLQLVQERRELARNAGREPKRGRFMDALPRSAELERSAYRLNVVAFPLWTFTIIAGAIWAEAAWGEYWNWDPKEVWSFVIWVVYAGYLHARVTRGWDGRRAAYLALAGYACLLFNFLAVNVLFVGMHSYAGV
jgi:cytochrome c-type biogenesis protein CcsB